MAKKIRNQNKKILKTELSKKSQRIRAEQSSLNGKFAEESINEQING